MMFRKIKMFASIFMVIVVIFSTMWIVFHVGIRYYVQSKIRHDLNSQIGKVQAGINGVSVETDDADLTMWIYDLKDELNDGYSEDFMYHFIGSFSEDSLVPINLMVINADFKHLSMIDDGIINYYKNNQDMVDEDNYRHIKINKTDYYIMVRSDVINDKNIIYFVFATPTELYKFVGKINVIFIIIVILFGIVLLLMSYRAGVKLERSKEKLKDYFQNASHELKTPIMSIQGYAEGISTNVIKNHEKAADVIIYESEKMGSLVQEILLLSKMDSGYADMSRQKLNLRDVIYDCMNLLETEAAKRKIEFLVDIDTQEEYLILGNESQLERAFSNILLNALRYAEHTIEVQIQRNRKWIRVNISDDGTGISESDMPHIFDRFYKGKNGGQHGIGLAIVKEIVLLHKGKIKAVNDNGAVFSVWLKAVKKEQHIKNRIKRTV